MIESYFHKGEGYNPFLIREGWQVAQLNHVSGHGLNDIERIEVHKSTDEVFILFKGNAVLVEAVVNGDNTTFHCEKMRKGVTYNIPAGTWHDIAMDLDVEIIIVEKSDTHKNDCEYLKLSQQERNDLYAMINKSLL